SAGSFDRTHEKQDSPLEPEAELPVQVVAGVELVVVELSTAARRASSPYDAFRFAPAVLDIGDVSCNTRG
ncbi:hypothetical protein A2U01_0086114, partial [Trifolium medium]|nr:hypothetical protein [Trifolium medium]